MLAGSGRPTTSSVDFFLQHTVAYLRRHFSLNVIALSPQASCLPVFSNWSGFLLPA
jgi:hypothetical protein